MERTDEGNGQYVKPVVVRDGDVTSKYVNVYYNQYRGFAYCTSFFTKNITLFGYTTFQARGDNGREMAVKINPWLRERAVRVEKRATYYRFYLDDGKKYASSPLATSQAVEAKPKRRSRNRQLEIDI